MVATLEQNANGTAAKTLARLTPRHLEDLRKSGLSDAQIVACGFHSLQAPASVQAALRWKKYDGSFGDCLAIPFFDRDGKPTGYSRLKPDNPRRNKEGRENKYESPKGIPNRLYIPPGTRAILDDPSQVLIATEGEKKIAAADEAGFHGIALTGVWAWQKKRGRDADGKGIGDRELIDDFKAIALQGRKIFVCYDSDTATNPNVRGAEWSFAEVLARHGADVKVIRLPPGEVGSDGSPAKVGLDDYLLKNGPDAFKELMAAATEPTPPEKGLTVLEAPDDPHKLARGFISERCQSPDGLILRYWRDEWHRWDGIAWRTLPTKELAAELTQSAKAEMDRVNIIGQKLAEENKPPPVVRKVNGRLVADVAHALQSLTILSGRVDTPSWLDERGPFPAAEVLPCQNGLIHLPSLTAGKDYFHPPTPRFFSPNALDFDFTLDAPKPVTWLDFLGRLWPDDLESIATLQEVIGCLLTADTRQQKIFLLIGPRRSGKGTIARVIRALLGSANVAGPTLSGLSTNFGLAPLLGKPAAIISDARLSGRSDVAAVVERLLSISGEDSLTIDRKFLPAVTVKLPTRFLILSNELPRLGDSSGALAGRMILLALRESWYGREDVTLTEKLLAERAGILLWSVQGWQRLQERGYFVQPEAGKELIGQLEDLASPVGAFRRELCNLGPECECALADLFFAWKTWCEKKGRKEPGTEATFARDLLAAVPSLRRVKRRDGEERFLVYRGIALR